MSNWTREELNAAVIAYIEMWNLDQRNEKFIKKRYYKELSEKFGRTVGAFEYRMGNISHVYARSGKQWVKGLKPLEHVGKNVSSVILELIKENEKNEIFHDYFSESQEPFINDILERIPVEQTTTSPRRDGGFRGRVLKAYDCRCAITGLKITNGGGRAEVEAAHIKPVKDDGPDIIQNGIALSGTIHWMLDRGLIGLSNDLEILISRQVNDPDRIKSMINKTGKANSPIPPSDRPHKDFLGWHRENCFKG